MTKKSTPAKKTRTNPKPPPSGGVLVISHGLPGSGKSTHAQAEVDKDPANRIRVNRDDLRTEVAGAKYHNGKPRKDVESKVTELQVQRISEALRAGKRVYCDDTNLNAYRLASLFKLARDSGATSEQVYHNVPVEECKRRNRKRGAEGGREVPEDVIDGMAKAGYSADGNIKEFVIGTRGLVFAVDRVTEGMKVLDKFNDELQAVNPFIGKAVVFLDVDGTHAHNAHEANRAFGRPGEKKDFNYFFKSIKDAPVNQEVVKLTKEMRAAGLNIVVLTGRDDQYAAELVEHLKRGGAPLSMVIAKRKGDGRPDSDFKRETIHKLRAQGLVPVHSIDDRERSVKVYESEGIMVTRVDEHIPEDPAIAPETYPAPIVSTIFGSGHCIRCGQFLKGGGVIGPKCATKI